MNRTSKTLLRTGRSKRSSAKDLLGDQAVSGKTADERRQDQEVADLLFAHGDSSEENPPSEDPRLQTRIRTALLRAYRFFAPPNE